MKERVFPESPKGGGRGGKKDDDVVVEWVPTGDIRTNGQPVLQKRERKITTPEKNMPPNFSPDELNSTTKDRPRPKPKVKKSEPFEDPWWNK